MAKEKKQAQTDAPESDGEAAPVEGAEPKKGFVKKLLGNKKLLIMVGAGTLVLLLGVGAGLYFFVFTGSSDDAKTKMAAAAEPQLPLTPPQVAFYDVPDLIVNIQTADGTAAYLKLSVSLELDNADEKAGLTALMPRVVDQFQGYLRELRMDDLKGSAGVMRLKEELLRRINAAAAPYRVRDVLLKEMIVQ
jgi:flagellar FliL protein